MAHALPEQGQPINDVHVLRQFDPALALTQEFRHCLTASVPRLTSPVPAVQPKQVEGVKERRPRVLAADEKQNGF